MSGSGSETDAIIHMTNKECCSICLEDIGASEDNIVLTCGHEFHRRCIVDWDVKLLRGGQAFRCPNCSQEVHPPSGIITRSFAGFDVSHAIDTPHATPRHGRCRSQLVPVLVFTMIWAILFISGFVAKNRIRVY